MRIGGQVDFQLRLRHAGAVGTLSLCLATLARAEPPRLIDLAGDSAVFEIAGQLVPVRRDEHVPGTGAKLTHVARGGILVEFPAAGADDAVTVEVKRGGTLARPAREVVQHLPLPAAQMRAARPRPDAGAASRAAGKPVAKGDER